MVENAQSVEYSENEVEKARKCHEFFKNREFQKALEILKELKSKRPNDFHIRHNLAICYRISHFFSALKLIEPFFRKF